MKILVVDDNSDDRRLLRYVIERYGHEVIEAGNGQEGLEMAAANKPDLIISDVLMPVMDGFQFLRNLKRDESLGTIPFIFYSATYKGYQDVRFALSLGAEGYIIKPKEPMELWKEVEQIIEEGKREKVITAGLIEEDEEYLKRYSLVIATKLEEKIKELKTEIAERKQAEDALHKLNRELQAISECNQVLMRADNEQALLDGVCRIICEKANYRMAWVGYAENDEGKTVRPIAWAGFENGYLEQVRLTWADTERGRGPGGRAIRCGESSSQDFVTDPQASPWRESALQRGYRTGIALPLKDENSNAFGVLNIYSTEPNAFTPEERSLLGKLAEDLAFGIMVLRSRTEHKHAEEALHISEARLRTLVQTIPDLIWLKDPEGVYLACNTIFERFFGAREADIIGKTDYDFVDKELADFFREHDRNAMAAGKSSSNEEWITFADDGHRALLDTIKTPMFDAEGKLIGVLGIARDITERKQAEEEKKKLKEQLLQAQKMEAIGQLAGGIAHDLNNILTAMIGYGHLLKIKLKEEDPLRIYPDQILALSDKAANLTQSLLAFSRKRIMNLEPVTLNEIINRIDHLLSRIIGEDIKLQTVLSEKDLIVMADSGQIEHVLMNLATNARDAMPKGGRLTIGTETVDIDHEFINEHGYGKEGEYALIAVTDTGSGMDRETMEKIFEPFFTTKEVGKGTGLGLAMVYGIIKQHDGYINVYSEPGSGTTFRIYLPLIKGTVEEIKRVVIQPVERGTETVLLAEDQTEVREFTKILLEEYGYKVITAGSGQEAIDEFKAHKDEIQLLLLDAIMPNKNGREAYEEIKKIKPDIRALFMSGYPADIIQKHEILEKGFAYIEKPASPTKLLKKIREVIGK